VGRFFFHSERSEGKNGPPGDKEERRRARGKDREAGAASAKQPYRLARSRAVPKGRPGAKRSGHTRPWEWRKDARPSASEKLLLACRIRQLERQNTGWSDMSTKTNGNQHTACIHGKSQRWRAWHWRLTDSQSARDRISSVHSIFSTTYRVDVFRLCPKTCHRCS
jgi:hypothetical protein